MATITLHLTGMQEKIIGSRIECGISKTTGEAARTALLNFVPNTKYKPFKANKNF